MSHPETLEVWGKGQYKLNLAFIHSPSKPMVTELQDILICLHVTTEDLIRCPVHRPVQIFLFLFFLEYLPFLRAEYESKILESI